MPSASEALLEFEFGQTPSDGYEELTNAGDNMNFYSGVAMNSQLWSGMNGRDPDIVVDGVINGGVITPSTTVDTVNISAALYNLGGTKEQSIAAQTDVALTRASTDTHIINSITITSVGTVVVIAGTEGTSFTSTRGATGGPPYVPVGSIEIGNVRLSSQGSGAVNAADIQQIDGLSRETPYYPFYQPQDVYGQGGICFSQAVPAIHTGDLPKASYAQYFVPIFGEVQLGKDFTGPTESATVNSDERYGGTAASISRSLNAGSVNVLLADGHTDPVIGLDRDRPWIRFYSSRHRTPHMVGQAILSIAINYPADNNINADITMAPETVWDQVVS